MAADVISSIARSISLMGDANGEAEEPPAIGAKFGENGSEVSLFLTVILALLCTKPSSVFGGLSYKPIRVKDTPNICTGVRLSNADPSPKDLTTWKLLVHPCVRQGVSFLLSR